MSAVLPPSCGTQKEHVGCMGLTSKSGHVYISNFPVGTASPEDHLLPQGILSATFLPGISRASVLVDCAHLYWASGWRIILGRTKGEGKRCIPLRHSFTFHMKQGLPTSDNPNTTRESYGNV